MTAASRIPTSLDDPPHFPRKQRVVLEGGMGQIVVRVMKSGSTKSTASHSECCMILHPREKALPISSVGNIVAPSIGALVPLTPTPQQVELMSKRYSASSKPSILTSTHRDTASYINRTRDAVLKTDHDAFYAGLNAELSDDISATVGCVACGLSVGKAYGGTLWGTNGNRTHIRRPQVNV